MNEARADLRRTMETMGIHLSNTAFEQAFARVSAAADQGGRVTDEKLRSIVTDASAGDQVHEGIVESFR